MRVTGIEEHFLTEDVVLAWRAAAMDAADPSMAFHSGVFGRRLLELGEERLALMDETGLDVQVLSLTTPMLHDIEGNHLDLARRTNDALAEVVQRNPLRFQALATLPVGAPDAAARELDRCVSSLGFKGTMLCGRTAGRNLDDPGLLPIFEAAAASGVPVLLHPRVPDEAIREIYYSGFGPEIDICFATFGLGWHLDAGIQFLRLVLAGVFDRLPGLQVILGHWGELVLFYEERFAAMNRVCRLDQPIGTYFRQNLYVTASGMFSPTYLERALGVVGPDRLLFSTDYPFQYRSGGDARRFIERAPLGEGDRAKFASGNWDRLTGDKPAAAADAGRS